VVRTEDEADDETNSCKAVKGCSCSRHVVKLLRLTSTHHATHLHCTAVSRVLASSKRAADIHLSRVDGPCWPPPGIAPTGTGIATGVRAVRCLESGGRIKAERGVKLC
jgi:hypothetical protein